MTKIIILGGGFGGIRAALDLEKQLQKQLKSEQLEIILIDKSGSHLFTPLLYETATACSVKDDRFALRLRKTVSVTYADIFAGRKIKFIQAEITEIGLDSKTVLTGGGARLNFDYLILACGSRAADFGIRGIGDYAVKFKTVGDAVFINQKLREIMREKKEQLQPQSREFFAARPQVLICGAGLTGVELAAEIASCFKKAGEGRIGVNLIEAGPKILPMASDTERAIIAGRLTKLGVAIVENSPIDEIGPDFVQLQNGQKINGALIIWTAGIQIEELLKKTAGLNVTENGRLAVDEFLRCRRPDGQIRQNVFAVGDIIDFQVQGKLIPAMALTAIEQGQSAARNAARTMADKKLKTYKPFYNIWIAPVGGKYALFHLGRIKIKGLLGWLIREMVHLRYLFSILPAKKALRLYLSDLILFTKNDGV